MDARMLDLSRTTLTIMLRLSRQMWSLLMDLTTPCVLMMKVKLLWKWKYWALLYLFSFVLVLKPDTLEAKDSKEWHWQNFIDNLVDKFHMLIIRKRLMKAAQKKSSAPFQRRSKPKKKTKLPGQPKKPMSAFFLWLIVVFVLHRFFWV